MRRQIKLLTKVSLCNFCGLNEFRFNRNSRKKSKYIFMGALWCFLIVMLIFYVCAVSGGLIYAGAGHLVPAVLSTCVSVIVFFFTTFKAGPVLFDKNAYEKQAALPVSISAIIISRFLSMYFTGLLLGMLIMIPGMTVYGIMEKPFFTFYLYGFAGSLFLPLLPLTAASVVGAVITGISSRWKRKNLVITVLTMLFICAVLIGSFSLSGMEENQLENMLAQIPILLEENIRSAYPPALWLTEALVYNRPGFLLLFLIVSLLCFLAFLKILQYFYAGICSLLGANEAAGNYRMKELRVKTTSVAMVERELRRYFSSPVYVTNTLVGELMMVIIAAALLIAGTDSVDQMLGISGIADRAFPVLLGMMPTLIPTTACSISMEGKQWWLTQTLPVTEKDVIQSKILMNILIALPFYLISELLSIIALKPTLPDTLLLLLVPAVYIVFGAEMGILVNQKFPVFDWENETKVVKQSASTSLMVLIGGIVGVLPIGFLICLPDVPSSIIYLATAAIMIMILCGLKAMKHFRRQNTETLLKN